MILKDLNSGSFDIVFCIYWKTIFTMKLNFEFFLLEIPKGYNWNYITPYNNEINTFRNIFIVKPLVPSKIFIFPLFYSI